MTHGSINWRKNTTHHAHAYADADGLKLTISAATIGCGSVAASEIDRDATTYGSEYPRFYTARGLELASLASCRLAGNLVLFIIICIMN
jgi:hypothetical protein